MRNDWHEWSAVEKITNSTVSNHFDGEGSLWATVIINNHGQITEILTFNEDASTQKWIEA